MCVGGSCWKEKVSGAMERTCILLGVALEQIHTYTHAGLPGGSAGKESTRNVGDLGSIPGLGRSPGEGKGSYSSVLAWRIPCPWGRKESDPTERLSVGHSVSCHTGRGGTWSVLFTSASLPTPHPSTPSTVSCAQQGLNILTT